LTSFSLRGGPRRRSIVKSTRSCRSVRGGRRGEPRRWCLQLTAKNQVSCLPSSTCSGALRGAHLADVRAMSTVGGPRQQRPGRDTTSNHPDFGGFDDTCLSEKPPFRPRGGSGGLEDATCGQIPGGGLITAPRPRVPPGNGGRVKLEVRVHSSLSLDTELMYENTTSALLTWCTLSLYTSTDRQCNIEEQSG
jgi:hypothetical protein